MRKRFNSFLDVFFDDLDQCIVDSDANSNAMDIERNLESVAVKSNLTHLNERLNLQNRKDLSID